MGNTKVVEKLRVLADKLEKQIDSKINPPIHDQNPTARRAKIARNMYKDGERLMAIQQQLRALANGHENETIPPLLAKIRNKAQLDTIHYSRSFPNEEKGANRLKKIGVTDENFKEAKEALESYISIKEETEKEKELRELEYSLLGSKIPGYFPTPEALVEIMLNNADIEPSDSVLEPSAGKGNIAEVIKRRHPNNMLYVVECNYTLRKILELKGFNVIGYDFLETTSKFDRIIMNPPFEGFRDIKHVRHAYDLLNEGGRIVSIMSEAPFFRSDDIAVKFREWLDTVGFSTKLPSGSFTQSGTGVNVRAVVIDK